MWSRSKVKNLCLSYLKELPSKPPKPEIPKGKFIASLIDHTLLKPTASRSDIFKLASEAKEYRFASICVNPSHVSTAVDSLHNSGILVCTVVGFPLGATTTQQKVYEAQTSIEAGAREIDMVINIGALLEGDLDKVYDDISYVADAVHSQAGLLKVIIETAYLNTQEKIIACLICKTARADFVKTSTGFAAGGATADDVDLMYRISYPDMQVKASGGIKNLADAHSMISAGAGRLGASAGVQITEESMVLNPEISIANS